MADQTLVRRINRARVLDTLRRRGRMSRSDIAALTALDKKSITNVIASLLEDGFVVEAGKKPNGMGRPFVLLDLRKDRHLAMGLSVSEQGVTAVLLNLAGEVAAVHEIEYLPDPSREEILRAARRAYEQLRGMARGGLDGVCVTAPGLVDLPTGTVTASVNLPALNGFNLRQAVAEFAREPVAFEEQTRAKTLAEKWHGLGRDLPGFVCIDLGIGIGAGIVQEGRVYRGSGPYAGEIGHIRVEPGGRPCRCGNRGCLEAYLSERALLKEINAAERTSARTFDRLERAGPAGKKVLQAAGRRLGVALSYVINLIGPPAIVLSGRLMRFRDVVLPAVGRGIAEAALPGLAARTEIRVSTLDHASARGAAALVLAKAFEVEGHSFA
jgi:predicted NBD/HSP70 family sugar kinase